MSIEICHVCDGYGYENVRDPDSLINEKIACRRCESSGRLVRTTTYETLSTYSIERPNELVEAARNLLNQVELSSPREFRSNVEPERAQLRAALAKVQQ